MAKKHEQIINAKLKDAIKKIIEGENNCYYDLDGTHKEKAIKSHSVWNNGILKPLANNNNKVFWIDSKKDLRYLVTKRIYKSKWIVFILGLLKRDEKFYKNILEYIDLENQKYKESKNNNFELLVQNLVVNVSENRVMSPSLYHKIKLNNDIEKFE